MTRPLYWWMKGSQGREKPQLNICWQVFLAAGKICLHFKSFDQVGFILDMFDQKQILIELLQAKVFACWCKTFNLIRYFHATQGHASCSAVFHMLLCWPVFLLRYLSSIAAVLLTLKLGDVEAQAASLICPLLYHATISMCQYFVFLCQNLFVFVRNHWCL